MRVSQTQMSHSLSVIIVLRHGLSNLGVLPLNQAERIIFLNTDWSKGTILFFFLL